MTVKLYRDEVSPHLDVLIDSSCSMALEDSPKAQATLGLAAVFATAASNVGYSHAAWVAGDGCRQVGNGTDRPSIWDEIDFAYRGDLYIVSFVKLPISVVASVRIACTAQRPTLARRPINDDDLAQFAERATAVVVVQVLAEADVNPTERGNIRLIDSETDAVQEIFLDSVAEKRYRDAFARHQESWHLAAKQTGAIMTTVVAEEILSNWRLEALVASEVLTIA